MTRYKKVFLLGAAFQFLFEPDPFDYCGAHQRKQLERLYRTITRPALANERVKRDGAGNVVLQLKSAWRDGTTHIKMLPLEFMQRLVLRNQLSKWLATRSIKLRNLFTSV